jgi:hypothetical protein
MRCLWPVDMYEYLLQETCCWTFTVVADISNHNYSQECYNARIDAWEHGWQHVKLYHHRPQPVDAWDRPRIAPVRPRLRQSRSRRELQQSVVVPLS